MNKNNWSGGCLCGQVRFRATREPRQTNICYCRQCQKFTGSQVPAFATYRLDEVIISGQEPLIYRSSNKAVRYFCGVCGSSLFWKPDGKGTMDILIGSFDQPEQLPAPTLQIWTKHQPHWLEQISTIESYEGTFVVNGEEQE